MNMILKALALSLCISYAVAVKGVDTQFDVSLDQMKCIKENTLEGTLKQYFIILRAQNGNNTVMGNLKTNLFNARQAGVNASQLMLYVQPCGQADGKQQIDQLFLSLSDEDVKSFSRIWINVETNPNNGCLFSKTQNTNCQLVNDMISEIKKKGKLIGIYSSKFMWDYYIGTQCV